MDRDQEICQLLRDKGKTTLGFVPIAFASLTGGMNNHLYKISGSNNQAYLLKIYADDNNDRLTREYNACSYLSKQHMPVPQAIYKDTERNFGIYSFEKGKPKKAADVTEGDIDGMVDFIIRLENLRPDYQMFSESASPNFCLYDYVAYLDMRQKTLTQSQDLVDFDTKAKDFVERVNLTSWLENEKTKLVSGISIKDWSKKLTTGKLTLSPLDFGPHNMLFDEPGRITFIDMEKFGWDDPTHLVVTFLNHLQTRNMPVEIKKYFLKLYFGNSRFADLVKKRMEAIFRIDQLGWIAFLAVTLTPDRLKHYLSARPEMVKEEYVNGQIEETNYRIKVYQEGNPLFQL